MTMNTDLLDPSSIRLLLSRCSTRTVFCLYEGELLALTVNRDKPFRDAIEAPRSHPHLIGLETSYR